MPPPRPTILRLGLATAALSLGLLCVRSPAAAAQTGPPPGSPEGSSSSTPTTGIALPSEPDALTRIVSDPTAEPADRAGAAGALVRLGEGSRANTQIRELLRSDAPRGVRRIVATELGKLVGPPTGLVPALAAGLSPEDAETASAVLAALARYYGRDAVWPVMTFLDRPGLSPALTEEAIQTLIAQTGRSDLGRDPARWREWWQGAQRLSDAAWRQEQLNRLGARATALAKEREATSRRLTDAYRRLHAATAEEGREELIVEMLGGDVPESRRLALELVNRVQLNARPVSERVAGAVALRLADPLPDVRASAATILARLDRPDLAPMVRRALDVETSPDAAAAMLRVLARLPVPSMVEAALRWLAGPAPADDAAVEALLAAEAADLLTDPEQTARVRSVLDERFPARLSPAALRLLTQLGAEARVIELLGSDDRTVALAAAEALSDRSSALPALLDAARRAAFMFDAASGALQRFRPNAEGFAEAGSLPAPSPSARDAALARYARVLPPPDLLAVASSETDAERREALLAPVGRAEFFTPQDHPGARGLLAVLLARTRLGLGRPAEALDALDAVPESLRTPSMAAPRVVALVCTGRLDEAAAVTEPTDEVSDAWLEALESCVDPARAQGVREAIAAGFAGVLSGPQIERFTRLGGVLPTPPAPAPAPTTTGPTVPER